MMLREVVKGSMNLLYKPIDQLQLELSCPKLPLNNTEVENVIVLCWFNGGVNSLELFSIYLIL